MKAMIDFILEFWPLFVVGLFAAAWFIFDITFGQALGPIHNLWKKGRLSDRKSYFGVIIEESLRDKAVLKKLATVNKKVEAAKESHQTPWLKQWTLRTVEVLENQAEGVAQEISRALETAHTSWYADFKNQAWHYIIYPNKVFKVNRKSKEEYDEAEKYGLALGIPSHQLINYAGEYKDR